MVACRKSPSGPLRSYRQSQFIPTSKPAQLKPFTIAQPDWVPAARSNFDYETHLQGVAMPVVPRHRIENDPEDLNTAAGRIRKTKWNRSPVVVDDSKPRIQGMDRSRGPFPILRKFRSSNLRTQALQAGGQTLPRPDRCFRQGNPSPRS